MRCYRCDRIIRKRYRVTAVPITVERDYQSKELMQIPVGSPLCSAVCMRAVGYSGNSEGQKIKWSGSTIARDDGTPIYKETTQ